ncbi:hypothetical protein [Neobacillus sp. DY30]|uniref:hypothetical protein n=1 Tax=Neobacillus sp. DY30 TaxID=3047871 RepID=UPI0024BF3937|nr:hypothetical protein [Neobacillus sp. DY30]WHY00908.1 hypothetical protein QNH29_00995 [Neobacillus sp. DY30]
MKKVLKPVFLLSFALLLIGNLLSGASEAFAAIHKGQASEMDLRVMTYNLRYLNNVDASPKYNSFLDLFPIPNVNDN